MTESSARVNLSLRFLWIFKDQWTTKTRLSRTCQSLQWVWDRGWRNIVIESDYSLRNGKAINASLFSFEKKGVLKLNIRSSIPKCGNWITRECLRRNLDSSQFSCIPSALNYLMYLDNVGIVFLATLP